MPLANDDEDGRVELCHRKAPVFVSSAALLAGAAPAASITSAQRASPDVEHGIHGEDSDLTILKIPGLEERGDDSVSGLFHLIVFDDNLDLDLGQEIHHVFIPPVVANATWMMAILFHLREGHTSDPWPGVLYRSQQAEL